MKLLWSSRSPFARKAMIVLIEKGLADSVDLVSVAVMMAAPANPDVLRHNPLCKIPVLVLDNGTALFDSRVICEYLDQIGNGPSLVPKEFQARTACLRLQALADGLTDILLLWRTELGRGSNANREMCGGFESKIVASMAQLELEVGAFARHPLNLGQVSVICALGQLDFRYPDCQWRDAHPALADWYADAQERASVRDTEIRNDGSAAMGSVDMPLKFSALLSHV